MACPTFGCILGYGPTSRFHIEAACTTSASLQTIWDGAFSEVRAYRWMSAVLLYYADVRMITGNHTDMSWSHRIHAAQAQVEDKQNKIAVIVESNAVVHPRTVVVHFQHTPAYSVLYLSL